MQFTINSKSLLSALTAVGRVAPAKAVLQILGSFLIEVNDNEVRITASDTENRASMTVQAITDGSGAFCIDARFISGVIKSLPDCPVTIDVADNGEVTITTAKNTFKAVSQAANQYPQSDFNETAAVQFILPTEALLMGLSETSFAVGTDDFHPQMMGVCMDVKPEQVIFVATDTRHLVKSEHQAQTGTETRCILSRAAIAAVTALAAKEPNVYIFVYPSAVEFKGEAFELRCQLIKGSYPDYNRVIPKNNAIVVTANRDELLGAIRRTSICADTEYTPLRLAIDGDNIEVKALDASMSRSAKEEVACESMQAKMTIGFSARYLISILSAVPTEKVVMQLSDSSRPAVILPDGDDQHLTMLLMPMNVN